MYTGIIHVSERRGILENPFNPELTYLKPLGVGFLFKGLAVSKQSKKNLKTLFLIRLFKDRLLWVKVHRPETIESSVSGIRPSLFFF